VGFPLELNISTNQRRVSQSEPAR